MKPTSYKLQNSCANCRFVEVIVNYDDGEKYICMFKVDKRPKCGSVYMKEVFDWFNDSELAEKELEEWDAFEKDHAVESNGICDNYEQKTH